MSMNRLEKIFDEIQIIRNTVTKSNEKYVVAGIESLAAELVMKSGESLRYNKNKTHPSNIVFLCDSIKVNIKSLISEYEHREIEKFMLLNMLTTIIKVKFIINEQI